MTGWLSTRTPLKLERRGPRDGQPLGSLDGGSSDRATR